jgi:hypothetical protein
MTSSTSVGTQSRPIWRVTVSRGTESLMPRPQDEIVVADPHAGRVGIESHFGLHTPRQTGLSITRRTYLSSRALITACPRTIDLGALPTPLGIPEPPTSSSRSTVFGVVVEKMMERAA